MNMEFSAKAEADIEEIAKWWSKDRDVGADLFFDHLYYVCRPEDNQLWVLTVWGTKRLEPKL